MLIKPSSIITVSSFLSLNNKYECKSPEALEASYAILVFLFIISHCLFSLNLLAISVGRESMSIEAASNRCTKTSAYLLIGDVK